MSPATATQLFGTPVALGLSVLALLALLLAVAAWTDLRQRRIPNLLVLSGAVLAVALHIVLPAGHGFISPLPGALGGMAALGGLACGLCAMWPLHQWFGMGAGDVKLTAMLGAFLGPQAIWPAILSSLLTGGVLAAALLLCRHRQRLLAFWPFASAVVAPSPRKGDGRLPYALAIALGSVGYLVFRAVAWGYFR